MFLRGFIPLGGLQVSVSGVGFHRQGACAIPLWRLSPVRAAIVKVIPLAEPRPRADHRALLVLRGTPCKPGAVALL